GCRDRGDAGGGLAARPRDGLAALDEGIRSDLDGTAEPQDALGSAGAALLAGARRRLLAVAAAQLGQRRRRTGWQERAAPPGVNQPALPFSTAVPHCGETGGRQAVRGRGRARKAIHPRDAFW